MLHVFLTNAQRKVHNFMVHGTARFGNSAFPSELLGTYRFKNNDRLGDPIIELKPDGKGLFQPHLAAPIPIRFWIETDTSGKPNKITSGNGDHSWSLIIQYGQSTNGNYPTGDFNMMEVVVSPANEYAVIFGERYKYMKPQ